MNTNEAAQFLSSVARAHPGKITITRDERDRWATDLAGISLDDANLAWAAWRADPTHAGHVLTAADVIAAHRQHAPSAPRPEHQPARIAHDPRLENDHVARRELAAMRALLPATPYRGRR